YTRCIWRQPWICSCTQSSIERYPLCRKQARCELQPASDQICLCKRQPHSGKRLQRKLSIQDLHPDSKLNPALHAEHLALIPEQLQHLNHNQRSYRRLEQPVHFILRVCRRPESYNIRRLPACAKQWGRRASKLVLVLRLVQPVRQRLPSLDQGALHDTRGAVRIRGLPLDKVRG